MGQRYSGLSSWLDPSAGSISRETNVAPHQAEELLAVGLFRVGGVGHRVGNSAVESSDQAIDESTRHESQRDSIQPCKTPSIALCTGALSEEHCPLVPAHRSLLPPRNAVDANEGTGNRWSRGPLCWGSPGTKPASIRGYTSEIETEGGGEGEKEVSSTPAPPACRDAPQGQAAAYAKCCNDVVKGRTLKDLRQLQALTDPREGVGQPDQ